MEDTIPVTEICVYEKVTNLNIPYKTVHINVT